jgi:hypothetical protein
VTKAQREQGKKTVARLQIALESHLGPEEIFIGNSSLD